MSEPITWRSISTPNFGSSAAIMNQGNDSMNQGIASLAGLAKGYADEQKGIAVSNAVAALSNTKNDADRTSVFDAHAANLRDHGIDLKDLIAANQAQHKTLQGDEAFKSSQELAASNLEGNALEQAGLAITNKANQGKLDYQVTEQQQQTDAADMAKRTGDFNISNGKAQTAIQQTNANTNAAQANDAIAQNLYTRGLTKAASVGTATWLEESQNTTNSTNGVPDNGKILRSVIARGVSPENALKGLAASKVFGNAEAIAASAALDKANQEKRDLEAFKQKMESDKTDRKDAIQAIKDRQDTSTHVWTGNFGQDTEKLTGDAAITAAAAIRVKDKSGKEVGISPFAIAQAVEKHSHRGNWNNGGDLDVDAFNEAMKMETSAIQEGVPVEELISKLKKELTTQQMMNGMR